MAYPAAAETASRSAKADSENFRRRLPLRPRGTRIGEAADNTHRDTVVDEGNKEAAP
jgi:predicted deacylase